MSEKIRITVIEKNADTGTVNHTFLSHEKSKALLQTLREGRVSLPSLCGSMGKCGRCLVRFLEHAPLPTPTERTLLTPEKLRQGYRLACMTKPVKEGKVEVCFEKDSSIDIVTHFFPEGHDAEKKSEGMNSGESVLAVDIGTTTIAMQLVNGADGTVLGTYTCMNPQRSFGLDVVSRINAGNGGNAQCMKEMVWTVLENGMASFSQKPSCIVIAGNTTMTYLLLGHSTEGLGHSPFCAEYTKREELEWKGIRTIVLPGISAFVGGDIVAGLYALGLHKTDKPWIFLDMGTNAEMVIGGLGKIIGTAAAAGPAFEGNSAGGAAGSARIKGIARLLKSGEIDESGLLQEPYFEQGIEWDGIKIGQKDIRDIQMAKAAVRAGIYFLMERFGLSDYEQIERVYLSGGFGFHLDKRAAVTLGLIPAGLEEKITAAGNTSLAGAVKYGRKLLEEKEDDLSEIIEESEIFYLAEQKNFEGVYIGFMDFRGEYGE